MHPDDREHVIDVWNRVLAVGQDQNLEYRLVTSNARETWVRDVIRRGGSTDDGDLTP